MTAASLFLASVLAIALTESTTAFQIMPLAPAARPATTQCPVFTSSYTVLPYTELPQRVSKTISHTSKKVQQANDLVRFMPQLSI